MVLLINKNEMTTTKFTNYNLHKMIYTESALLEIELRKFIVHYNY